MTKKELLPLAKTYFDNDSNRVEIYGTEDKHFYNTVGDARQHCDKDEKAYYHFTLNDFDANLVEQKEAEEIRLAKEKQDQKEELAMAEQIKKEDLLKKRELLVAPYSEFKSNIKLTLETSEGTFKKLLAELKAKKNKK